jgi:hypothetical protein
MTMELIINILIIISIFCFTLSLVFLVFHSLSPESEKKILFASICLLILTGIAVHAPFIFNHTALASRGESGDISVLNFSLEIRDGADSSFYQAYYPVKIALPLLEILSISSCFAFILFSLLVFYAWLRDFQKEKIHKFLKYFAFLFLICDSAVIIFLAWNPANLLVPDLTPEQLLRFFNGQIMPYADQSQTIKSVKIGGNPPFFLNFSDIMHTVSSVFPFIILCISFVCAGITFQKKISSESLMKISLYMSKSSFFLITAILLIHLLRVILTEDITSGAFISPASVMPFCAPVLFLFFFVQEVEREKSLNISSAVLGAATMAVLILLSG